MLVVYTEGVHTEEPSAMIQTNVRYVRQNISRLLDKVLGGEEVVIQRRGESIARIVPIQEHVRKYLPSLKAFRNAITIKGSLTKTLLSEREGSR